MAIEFTCPACGATLRVADDAAGRLVRCGGCLSALRVPELPAAPPDTRRLAPPTATPAEEFPPRAEPSEPDSTHPPRRRGPLFWLVVASGLLAGGMCACCCGFAVLMPSPKWRSHESQAGGFKVELPADPRAGVSAPGLRNTDGEKVVGARLWNQEVYAVAYDDIPEADKGRPAGEFLDNRVTELKTIPNIQVRRERAITVSGFPGQEIEFVADNGGTYVLRLVIADHRLYRLVAGGKSVRSGDENVRRFLDSFEITDPKLLAAAKERDERRRREERIRVAAARLLADTGLRIRRAVAAVHAATRHAPS